MKMTKRRIEVGRMIAMGEPVKTAAVKLGITYKSVCLYRQQLYAAFGVHDRIGFMRRFIKSGYIDIRDWINYGS